MTKLPDNMQTIIEDFQYCVGKEKLEYLIELAGSLRPLPDWLRADYHLMHEIKECMSPVHVHVSMADNGLRIQFDIPEESPTVRGYGAVLQQGLEGITLAQLQHVPDDLYIQLGLQEVISGQRLNGIKALMSVIKGLALGAAR